MRISDWSSDVCSSDLPSKLGPYVMRVKFAPGHMRKPHFNKETRYVLVLKGTWWAGWGPSGDHSTTDRKSVGKGKRGAVSVYLEGTRIIEIKEDRRNKCLSPTTRLRTQSTHIN